jgi:hypothetical protein
MELEFAFIGGGARDAGFEFLWQARRNLGKGAAFSGGLHS